MSNLSELTEIAFDRFYKGQSFTREETKIYFDYLVEEFGEEEASGFLNLCLDTVEKHSKKITFDKAVVETINMISGNKEVLDAKK